MQHLAAYKSFAAVTYLLAVCDSIAVDEHLYIVCVKVEVKLYTVSFLCRIKLIIKISR